MASSTDNLSLEEMVRHIYASTNRMEAILSEQQVRVTNCETNVQLLNRQVYDLQNIVNLREQEARGLSIRINGFPFTDEEKTSDSKFLMKKVYDRILLPMLNYAKSRNEIDKVPTINSTIVSCYRVGPVAARTNTASPPPILLKFANAAVRLAVLKNKRQHTPAPTAEEKSLGITHFTVMEDLTPQCYKLLRELQKNEDIAKAWTAEGKIRFLLRGGTYVHKVKSVFDPANVIINKAKSHSS
jgi:hypothetical protein